jgi:hypothetical protein
MQRIPHVPLVICDGFFGFPAFRLLEMCGSSIAGLVPAGVLELIEQLFLQLHLLKLWLAFIAQVGVPL